MARRQRNAVDPPAIPPRPDLYISADVETDGPIPSPYSMLSFGLAVAGAFDGEFFEPLDPTKRTFCRELRPISDQFEPEALAVNGLDREELARRGTAPAQAMGEAAEWLAALGESHRLGSRRLSGHLRLGLPLLVLHPVHGRLAVRVFLLSRHQDPLPSPSRNHLRPLGQERHGAPGAAPAEPHTHNALDDAVEQALLFRNVFAWVLEGRGASRHAHAAHISP